MSSFNTRVTIELDKEQVLQWHVSFLEQGVGGTLGNPTCFSTVRILTELPSSLEQCKKGRGSPDPEFIFASTVTVFLDWCLPLCRYSPNKSAVLFVFNHTDSRICILTKM